MGVCLCWVAVGAAHQVVFFNRQCVIFIYLFISQNSTRPPLANRWRASLDLPSHLGHQSKISRHLKGYSEIIAVTTPSILIKSKIFVNPERNSENMHPKNLIISQPSVVGTNVTRDTQHTGCVYIHDSLYILVE